MFQASDLTPILSHQPGVCGLCRGWSTDFAECYQCHAARGTFRYWTFPSVLPLGLAVHHGPLATALADYKYNIGRAQASAWASLQSLIQDYGRHHIKCLLDHHGITGIDLATWVPSSRNPEGVHHVASLVNSTDLVGTDLVDLLDPKGDVQHQRQAATGRAVTVDRFSVPLDLRGANVLVIDDTWTSGGSALSAAHALFKAEAENVVIVTLGRHFQPGYKQGHIYSSYANELGFDPQWCTYCDPRPRADPPLTSRMSGDDH